MPLPKVYPSVDEAVADIFDGATVLVGGFARAGNPFNLLGGLLRQGAKDLTVVMNGGGGDGRTRTDVSALIYNDRVRRVIASFPVAGSRQRENALENKWQEGKLQLDIVPQGTLAESIRAAGVGIGAYFTPTGVGTPFGKGKESRVINGKEMVLEYAIPADFALIKASKADRMGNLVYWRAARNFNPIMAAAARVTIVEVDEIVDVGKLDPDIIVTPGIYVNRIVQVSAQLIRD